MNGTGVRANVNRRNHTVGFACRIRRGLYPGLQFDSVLGADACGVLDNGTEVVVNPGTDWGDDDDSPSPKFRVRARPPWCGTSSWPVRTMGCGCVV